MALNQPLISWDVRQINKTFTVGILRPIKYIFQNHKFKNSWKNSPKQIIKIKQVNLFSISVLSNGTTSTTSCPNESICGGL